MNRLKGKEKDEYRVKRLAEQNNICTLCGNHIAEDEAVLDHDHDSGLIRDVLHRSCNSSEGRILAFAYKRCRADDPMTFIKNLVAYWQADYSANPLHPGHKLPEEEERLKLKRKLKKLKSPKHIEKTKARITELTALIKQLT